MLLFDTSSADIDRTGKSPVLFNAGKVYTPVVLAEWVASLLLEHAPAQKKLRAVDPACGDGELLLAIKNKAQQDISFFGADIDAGAIKNVSKKFPGSKFNCVDALMPHAKQKVSTAWLNMLAQKKADILIANPPWGADFLQSRSALQKAGYTLARGQFDSWDLFVELALNIVKKGGLIGLIIPDAIFLPEHEPLREMLNAKTTILSIARLGEGVFENVSRGTAVVILKNAPCPEKHMVECMRFNKAWRADVLGRHKTFADARKNLSHKIPQIRFSKEKFSNWDIDTPETEKNTLLLISSAASAWTQWLETGRGVELSKLGKVLECSGCGWVLPTPRKPRNIECAHCGVRVYSEQAPAKTIVRKNDKPQRGWLPLIVGEDVDRYKAAPGRLIKAAVTGINYKDSDVYAKRRILVRKTGVGIKASIVEGGPMINQVVYHYYEKENAGVPPFYLSYVLGVLCSRVMFAYHLRKSGETEWRSHPYLTQKTIARLPIPLPKEGTQAWKQAKAIAASVDRLLKNGGENEKLDLKIESLVAGLFALKKSDLTWVQNVIDSAQDMEPMRALKADLSSIDPVCV